MDSDGMDKCELEEEEKTSLLQAAISRKTRHNVRFWVVAMIMTIVAWCFLWYLGFVPSVTPAEPALPHLGLGAASDVANLDPPIADAVEAASTASPTVATASKTLLPLALTPLPLGSIKPGGWLASELSNSARGLAGHLHDFYYYVKDSKWYGGSREYSGLNEGFPYWFNGLVPLAYSLPEDDPDAVRLKEQVHVAATYVLDHQAEDGWIGPEIMSQRGLWSRFPFCMGLTQLTEANATWEARTIPAMRKFVSLMHGMLKHRPQGYRSESWAQIRHADMIVTLHWLLEKYPSEQDGLIWETMQMLYDLGKKWEAWYNEVAYIKEDLYRVPGNDDFHDDYMYQHGVNVAQGLKAPAVVRRFTHNNSLLQTVANAVQWTFQYHGAASGTVLGDERIDGLSPYSGSELCTAVEAIVSLSYLYQAIGTNLYADRAELAAFNALPTMLTSDHWAHQYMAQPNQPFSVFLKESPFFNSRELAQTFGLEPEYPCCTTNHPQGLPKFISNSWVRTGASGLAHVHLSPGSIMLDDVMIACETAYPFSETLSYTIKAKSSFSLSVRVPTWAGSASSILMNGAAAGHLFPDPVTGLHEMKLPAGDSNIVYKLEAVITEEPRANSSIAVRRGPLLYALEVGSLERSQAPRFYRTAFDRWRNATNSPGWVHEADDAANETLPTGYAPPEALDWTLTNTTAWNVAIDPTTLRFHSDEAVLTKMPSQIWSPGAPPVSMTAMGCQIAWPLFRNTVPGAVPPLEDRKCLGEAYKVRLRPYGSQKLHMAELPTIDLSK